MIFYYILKLVSLSFTICKDLQNSYSKSCIIKMTSIYFIIKVKKNINKKLVIYILF